MPATPPPKTYKVKSFGCQMNVYDGDRMAELLAAQGMSAAAEGADADLVVLNTCHIREKAAEKVYSDIGRLKRKDGSTPLIAVAGCVAQAEGEEIMTRAPSVNMVVGPQAYHRLPEMLGEAVAGRTPGCGAAPYARWLGTIRSSSRTTAGANTCRRLMVVGPFPVCASCALTTLHRPVSLPNLTRPPGVCNEVPCAGRSCGT